MFQLDERLACVCVCVSYADVCWNLIGISPIEHLQQQQWQQSEVDLFPIDFILSHNNTNCFSNCNVYTMYMYVHLVRLWLNAVIDIPVVTII